MKKSVQMGANKTGLATAPVMSAQLLDGADDAFKPLAQAPDDFIPEQTYIDIRQSYARQSGPVGTVPPPATLKGMVNTGVQKLTMRHPEMFIDKLGERLAYERTGVRLYEALIQKCELEMGEDGIQFLRRIAEDEKNHFLLLKDAMKSIGADPTAMTPCADVAGVMAKGLLAVITDPRTSLAQSANAILAVELIDNDGWDLLIELSTKAGLTEFTPRFEEARASEERHLAEVRSWLRDLVGSNDVKH